MGAMMPAQHAISRDRSEPQAMSPARRPRVASPDALLGNQARLRRLTAAPVALQAKLIVGTVDDPLEREADAVADQVMRMPDPRLSLSPSPPVLSRKCAACEEKDKLWSKLANGAAGGSEVPESVTEALQSSGESLDKGLRDFFEPRFGADFSSVRVHYDECASHSARQVGARAYAVGNDLVFGAGEYEPGQDSGRRLIAHELAHVVQQGVGGGVESPTRLFRSPLECAKLIANPPLLSMIPGGGAAIHQLISEDFAEKVPGAVDGFVIPGASFAPSRTDAICGGPSRIINPQVVGGQAGGGLPDLALRNARGVMLVAEIKPAVVPCLIDGENQELGYIDQGNATDPAQVAWRAAQGITVVAPMRESNYTPPSFSLAGDLEVETAWCVDGLMGYTIYRKGQKVDIPVTMPVPAGDRASEDDQERVRRLVPQVPDWVLALLTAALVVGIVACFASGLCEVGFIVAALGDAIGWILINAMRLAGAAFVTAAATR
jgi:hypothetical protein